MYERNKGCDALLVVKLVPNYLQYYSCMNTCQAMGSHKTHLGEPNKLSLASENTHWFGCFPLGTAGRACSPNHSPTAVENRSKAKRDFLPFSPQPFAPCTHSMPRQRQLNPCHAKALGWTQTLHIVYPSPVFCCQHSTLVTNQANCCSSQPVLTFLSCLCMLYKNKWWFTRVLKTWRALQGCATGPFPTGKWGNNILKTTICSYQS